MKKPSGHRAQEGAPSPLPVPNVERYSAPVAFFVILSLLTYLGHAELGYNSGEFSARVYEPYADVRAIPKVGGEVNPVEEGRDVYMRLCSACHQPGGGGNPANQCPPLAKSDWVLTEGPARVIRIVLNGSKGPITVNGKLWNTDVGMLPFRDVLTDEQIAHVLTYVRQSPEWGNQAGAVNAEQVKAVREKTAGRTMQWTPAELEKIPVLE